MRYFLASTLLAVSLAGGAVAARAAVESVLVKRCTDEYAVVQRPNGDLWRLVLASRCLSLRGYAGRLVLMQSRIGFPGPEPQILLPELDLACSVFRADSVGHAAPPPARSWPHAGLGAMREALEAMGYNCGPLEERGWTADAAQAFTRYRESRRLDDSPHGLRRAVTALAIDALGGRRPSGSGLRRSQAIAAESEEIVDFLVSGGSAECSEPTFVREVAADSSYITLLDGTVWDVAPARRGPVLGWHRSDGVIVCRGRLVNLHTGEMARATRLR